MRYRITKITDSKGNIKTEDRYPNRIGSEVSINIRPIQGYPFIFRYVKYDNLDNCIEDHITKTSTVLKTEECCTSEFTGIIITTLNSIYYFQEMEN